MREPAATFPLYFLHPSASTHQVKYPSVDIQREPEQEYKWNLTLGVFLIYTRLPSSCLFFPWKGRQSALPLFYLDTEILN